MGASGNMTLELIAGLLQRLLGLQCTRVGKGKNGGYFSSHQKGQNLEFSLLNQSDVEVPSSDES
jgi:hypothetical protein